MIKLAIAITSFGNRAPERYGPFIKTKLPGRDRPAHVFRRSSGDSFYDESTLADFNKDLEKLTRDPRFSDHGVTVVAFAEEVPASLSDVTPPEVTPEPSLPEVPAEPISQPAPVETPLTCMARFPVPVAFSNVADGGLDLVTPPADSTGELPDEPATDVTPPEPQDAPPPAIGPPPAPKAKSHKKK